MLFGTFHNPKDWDATCGFGQSEHQLMSMLMGRKVTDS